MRNRLLFGSVAGTIIGSVFAFSRTLIEQVQNSDEYKSNQKNDYFDTTKKDYGLTKYGNDESFIKKLFQPSLAVQQAFTDIGFSGPVNVRVKHGDSFNVSAAISRDEQWKKCVNVDISMSSLYDLHRHSLEDFYALSGREAIHVTHNSEFLTRFAAAFTFGMGSSMLVRGAPQPFVKFLKTSPAVLFMTALVYYSACRKSEIDADISSAKKLGTADRLKTFSSLGHQKNKETLVISRILENLTTAHPNNSLRIKKLEKFNSSNYPMLFNRKKIEEDSEKRIKSLQESGVIPSPQWNVENMLVAIKGATIGNR